MEREGWSQQVASPFSVNEVAKDVVPPKCSAHHDMIVSDYSEGGYTSGYVCDKCRGQSSKGHLGGSRERWFCLKCQSDICFKCTPKVVVPDGPQTKKELKEWIKSPASHGTMNSWNVSKITDMSGLFYGNKTMNENISSWNVSNVTDMSYMFCGANAFNQNLKDWNVSNVTNMCGMFYDAQSMNQSLESWNVSNVENMGNIFNGASVFNQSLEKWNTSKVQNMGRAFFRVAALKNKPSWYK